MVTWSFFGLLLIHSWKWFLQISLSIGHIVPFKMTLLSGTKMILRQKGRWFLTTNSQFAILTELSAREQYGLCLIMPKVFWFLKLHVLTLDTAKPELLIFFLKCPAFPLCCCLYDHFIYFPSKKRKTISLLDSLLYQLLINSSFSMALRFALFPLPQLNSAKYLIILWVSSCYFYLIGLLTFLGKGTNIC